MLDGGKSVSEAIVRIDDLAPPHIMTRMRRLPLLAPLLLLATACGGGEPRAEPQPEPSIDEALAQPTPPPIPAAWTGLIGEYVADTDTVSVLEDGRVLFLLPWGGERLALSLSGDGTIATPNGQRVTFRPTAPSGARELLVGDRPFLRISLGAVDGGTFRITPLRPTGELRAEALAATPPREDGDFRPSDLVELIALDSTIALDIRYATTNNFMGDVFYSSPRAFLQRPAAEALVRAHRRLAASGYGLLVHDGYRPWYVTKMFWDATPEELRIFVADPASGSRHNRGAAVDLTLFDRVNGAPVVMTGGYDEMSPRSFPDYPGGTSRQRWYRELLRTAMEAEGFAVYEAEWWHFDYGDWRRYRIGNLRFEELGGR
jgi:D-alanyl-D-alanine dipeptidase